MAEKLIVEVKKPDGTVLLSSEVAPTVAKDSYRSAVAEAHAILDELGVPSAKGQHCTHPRCSSDLTHRILMLGEKCKAQDSILARLKNEADGHPNLESKEVLALVNGAPAQH